MTTTIVVERWPDRSYVAYVRDLMGCAALGDSRAEAIDNIKEVLEIYCEDCRATGDGLPDLTQLDFSEVENTDPWQAPWERFTELSPSPEIFEALKAQGFKPVREHGSHVVLRRDPPFNSRLVVMKRFDRASLDEAWSKVSDEEKTLIEAELICALPSFTRDRYIRAKESDPTVFQNLHQTLIDSYVQRSLRSSHRNPGTVVMLPVGRGTK